MTMCKKADNAQDNADIDDKPKFPRVYTDTPTGEPITLTEEEFNNLVELFRELAAIRDRNKTPK